MLCMIVETTVAIYEIHMLNRGEHFPNFGGSRTGLIARRSASLIVRARTKVTDIVEDIEHDIHDPAVWQCIARWINGNGGDGVVARTS